MLFAQEERGDGNRDHVGPCVFNCNDLSWKRRIARDNRDNSSSW